MRRPVNCPQYLSARYLTILETRHGLGFAAFARRRALATHEAGDLHVENLGEVIASWQRRSRPCSNVPVTTLPAATSPLPLNQWPRWALWLHRRREDGEGGLGDTLARILDRRGGASFKRWFKAITGHDCGCGDRQARLNLTYPYPSIANTPEPSHA